MTQTRPYRVRGTLLATRSAACFLRDLDIADVDHDLVDVDLTLRASAPKWAAQDAGWIAANSYATWCWREAPAIEQVVSGVEVLLDPDVPLAPAPNFGTSWPAIRAQVIEGLRRRNPNHSWLREEEQAHED